MFGFPLVTARGWGKKTQSADTIITRLITPVANAFTRLVGFSYLAAGTAHTLTVMRPLGVTTFTADAGAAQAVVNIAAQVGAYSTITGGTPSVANNNMAANDFVVYEAADGTFVLDTISSISTLAVTLATNLPTGGVVSGGKLWWFGIITDTNPADGLAHPTFTLTASVTTERGDAFGEAFAGIVSTIPHPPLFTAMPTGSLYSGKYQPMILHSGNATAAGVLESAQAVYTER